MWVTDVSVNQDSKEEIAKLVSKTIDCEIKFKFNKSYKKYGCWKVFIFFIGIIALIIFAC